MNYGYYFKQISSVHETFFNERRCNFPPLCAFGSKVGRMIYKMLTFTSGPGTIVDPHYIKEIAKHNGVIQVPKEILISEDHRLFLQGQLGGFRIYILVEHPRPEIVPQSVRRISDSRFIATIRLEKPDNSMLEHEVTFRHPEVLGPWQDVSAAVYGIFPDAFQFSGHGQGSKSFICDATFLTLQAENPPPLPLKVRYIGIAKAEDRHAEDRLGEGHEKLQAILAEFNRRPTRKSISVVLYRPVELDPPVLAFPDVIETIEAVMIQYFKPSPYNVERIKFPNDSPALCKKLRKIGSQMVDVEIESPKGTEMWSDTVAPSSHHKTQVVIP